MIESLVFEKETVITAMFKGGSDRKLCNGIYGSLEGSGSLGYIHFKKPHFYIYF